MYRDAIGTIAKRDSNNASSDTERKISSWIEIYHQLTPHTQMEKTYLEELVEEILLPSLITKQDQSNTLNQRPILIRTLILTHRSQ